MNEDQHILKRYVRENSREALDQLARRYRDLVYSAALRQVRDPHLAEDVTQAVFIVLSRKANTIREGVAIGGWLLAVTRRASVDAMRKQAIQHRHEHAAARAEASIDQNASSEWEQIASVIDEAMSHLSSKDRDAVVLRYFEDQPFVQVGQVLRISEAAARKRVGRALERLRGLLSRRGSTLGVTALGTMITAHSVHAAPVTMMISTAAASSGAMSIAKGAIHMMAWAKAKAAVVVVLSSLFAVGGGVFVVKVALAQQAPIQPTPTTQAAASPFFRASPATQPTTGPGSDDAPAIAQAKVDIQNLETSIDAFEIDTGHYPTGAEGLDALTKAPPTVRNWRGPYFIKVVGDTQKLDPWQHPYRYMRPGIHNKTGFDLWSAGPDGIDGTDDDITNWQK